MVTHLCDYLSFKPMKDENNFLRRIMSMTGVYGIHGLECLSRSCTILKDEKGHSTKNFLFAFGFGLPTLVLLLTNISIRTNENGS